MVEISFFSSESFLYCVFLYVDGILWRVIDIFFSTRNHCENSMSILITEFFVLLKTTIVPLILIASRGTDSHIYFSKVLSSQNFRIALVRNAFMCNGSALTIYVNILFGFFEGLSNWSSYHGYLCRQSLSDPDFSLFHYPWGLRGVVHATCFMWYYGSELSNGKVGVWKLFAEFGLIWMVQIRKSYYWLCWEIEAKHYFSHELCNLPILSLKSYCVLKIRESFCWIKI